MANIATTWKELSGENEWEGLLDPLDNDLRKYIIHYGERAQALLDAFNNEKASEWIGFSRYPDKGFSSFVGLDKGDRYEYEVTKFIYAREVDQSHTKAQTSWIGFVAVATDTAKAALGRRDVLIAWRATMLDVEFEIDCNTNLVAASKILKSNEFNAKVHEGWLSVYTSKDLGSSFTKTSAREQVLHELGRVLDIYKEEEISITITGYSMGAALATLNAVDIVDNGHNHSSMVTAFLFASPRVGDKGFNFVFSKLNNLHALRINNYSDMVPLTPSELQGYTHVGQELMVFAAKSPYLKELNSADAHRLEIYLHGVAGSQGPLDHFDLKVDRDVSLLNKNSNVLKDEYKVPVEWWVEKNKGMVQQDDGFWKLVDYVPLPPTD